jgi:hypothetical protein
MRAMTAERTGACSARVHSAARPALSSALASGRPADRGRSGPTSPRPGYAMPSDGIPRSVHGARHRGWSRRGRRRRPGPPSQSQPSLFAPEPSSEPAGSRPIEMRALITVKAAPNPRRHTERLSASRACELTWTFLAGYACTRLTFASSTATASSANTMWSD